MKEYGKALVDYYDLFFKGLRGDTAFYGDFERGSFRYGGEQIWVASKGGISDENAWYTLKTLPV